jgi:hypothetical protein
MLARDQGNGVKGMIEVSRDMARRHDSSTGLCAL